MMRDVNVDQIKKLWVLDIVIQTGSLKTAALQAKVSPSAVSQSISSLEKTFGRPLLIRERGLVKPTPEALAVLDIVRPAFEAFDRLREVSHVPVPRMTWLSFGTYESIAIHILPGLLRRLRERMPDLRLSLRVTRTAQLLTMVRKGELCSALVTEVDDLSRFHVREVGRDQLGFFVSRKHPISELGWSAVEQYGIGSLAPGSDGLPRYFTKFLRRAKSDRAFVLSDSFETLRCAAVSGAVVAVLPHRVANRDDSLMEIFPDDIRPKGEQGAHRILLVSQLKCDPEEAEFLASEVSLLLDSR